MKKQIRNFVLSAGFAALFSATVLTAQTKLEVAEVPFEFHVGQTTLSAGNYTVSHMANQSVIQLRNEETHKTVSIAPIARGNDKGRANLSFRCYGEQCFLSEVAVAGSPSYMLKKTSLENETANNGKQATVAYIPVGRR